MLTNIIHCQACDHLFPYFGLINKFNRRMVFVDDTGYMYKGDYLEPIV